MKSNTWISMEQICQQMSSRENWYALRTRRHHERIVHDILKAKNFCVYLPLIRELRRWKHRKKYLNVPLFPNYIFVYLNLDNGIDVMDTRGVIELVGTYSGPSPIPAKQIEFIRITVESKMKKDPYPFLAKGKPVRVKKGILKGHEGVLLQNENIHKFVVSIPILGQSVGVQIEASDLEVI